MPRINGLALQFQRFQLISFEQDEKVVGVPEAYLWKFGQSFLGERR
jgi:hypothetical protein